MTVIDNTEVRYIDYEVLEDVKCLAEEKIIIYGAGYCGRQAAEMLQQMGILRFDFCDRDIHKHGMSLMGGVVYSIAEIEKLVHCLIIIAIEDEKIQKEIELSLKYLKNVRFLSFFALKAVWKYTANDYTALEHRVEAYSKFHHILSGGEYAIAQACKYPILVYQYGKVGSSTVSSSLSNAGIANAHIHRFFAENDIRGKLIMGEGQDEFIQNSGVSHEWSPEYVREIKTAIKGKKIITLVREPIAVDLSKVFQWIGDRGIADRYIACQISKGQTFLQAVSNLTMSMQGLQFAWFNRELKKVCDIDILDYPFDREKGYIRISANEVEILLIKAEKLSQMTEVIRDFTGNRQLELCNANIGEKKAYAHIYEQVKKKIRFPEEYVEYYYKNNPYMDHFYSKEEQQNFYHKWVK